VTEHNKAADYPLGTVLRDPKTGRLAMRFQQDDDSTGKGMHAWYVPAPDPTDARVLHHVEVYGWEPVELPPGVADMVRAVLERQDGELSEDVGTMTVDANELRAGLANALHNDWCGCDSWDGTNCETYYEGEFGLSASAALAVVAPVLERQAAEVTQLTRDRDDVAWRLKVVEDSGRRTAEELAATEASLGRWREQAGSRPAIPADAVNTWQLEADLSTAIASTGEAGGSYNDMASSAMHVALQHMRRAAPVSGSDTTEDGGDRG